ncbi:hypothetical protein SUNI508_06206 [Seiridium unicorne]|uniref:Uncharacterized protein n=1 Tax=Seiridium unicorne TaxID=138068 RepID=A0ABR2V3H6_9PEZI
MGRLAPVATHLANPAANCPTDFPTSSTRSSSDLPGSLSASDPSPYSQVELAPSKENDFANSLHRAAPMPSVTRPESPMLSGKKRRRDDNGDPQMPLYAVYDSTSLGPRSADCSRPCSVAQTPSDDVSSNPLDRIVFHSTNFSGGFSPSLAEALQRKIRPMPSSKRARVSDDSEALDQNVKDENHYTQAHSNYSTPPISPQIRPQAAERTTSSAPLSPCHICHRKPTKKSDLDSFADCQGCGQRTCYVCIRQCQGWLPASPDAAAHQPLGDEADEPLSRSFTMHDVDDDEQWASERPNAPVKSGKGEKDTVGWNAKGHSSVVCSRCCVERGSEGDVMCLGCLAGVEGS